MRKDYYKHGDYNALCDVCGFKYKASELKRRWDGLMVCDQDFETRHPLDFFRVRPESNRVKFINKETLPEITISTSPITVLVTLLDIDGNPAAGIIPEISNENPHIATTSNMSASNASGQTTFTITPVAIGTTWIKVHVGSVYSSSIKYVVEGT